MSKYVLAKDLPFAERGTEVSSYKNQCELEPGLQVYIDIKNIDSDIVDYAPVEFAEREQVFIGAFSYLKETGWIEEVKPREFTLILNEDDSFSAFYDDRGYGYEANRAVAPLKTIKVREVL